MIRGVLLAVALMTVSVALGHAEPPTAAQVEPEAIQKWADTTFIKILADNRVFSQNNNGNVTAMYGHINDRAFEKMPAK